MSRAGRPPRGEKKSRDERLNRLFAIVDRLRADTSRLRPGPPVAYVYNPLEYAGERYREYLRRYALPADAAPDRVLFVGMNPGPWGMTQTGVPFGAISWVRDWLRLEGPVGRPAREHPKKRVTGFACRREEVSGARVWGWARDCFGTPEAFFRRFFVWNYCPLMFLDPEGRNLTPDRLRAADQARLVAACDLALCGAVDVLACPTVVGIGEFAYGRVCRALAGTVVRIGKILHPSPASPLANDGWAAKATAQLRELGITVPAPRDR